MACEVPRSGRYGFVGDYTGESLTRFARVNNWRFNQLRIPEVRYYSGTRFGPQRIPGFYRNTGTFEGFGGNPPLFAGDAFTVLLYTAPTSGVPCTEGCAYVVPAIVDTLTINWNWTAENHTINWSIGFSATGEAEKINFDDPCDDTLYCEPGCITCPLLKDPCNNNALVEWCNQMSATLTFNANNIPYSNCSTNCQEVRTSGNLDWTLDVETHNKCDALVKGYDYILQFYINASQYWWLELGHYLGSNVRVNMQTAEIIGMTQSFAMQAVNCCISGAPAIGAIIDPNGTTVWPYETP